MHRPAPAYRACESIADMTDRPENPEPQSPPDGLHVRAGCVIPEAALRFAFVRSSGPGGQNVNKRATQAQLRVSVSDIPISPAAAGRLRTLAGARRTDADEILISADRQRSQRRNLEDCLERLRVLVLKALSPPKKRVATKPTRASKKRRLEAKSQKSDRKASRRGLKDE